MSIRRLLVSAAVACAIVFGGVPAAAAVSPGAIDLAAAGWIWPLDRFRIGRAFVAPSHAYGPGHRGIDLEPVGAAVLRAPADGVIAFSGQVAGRGILTVDHGDGLVTTLEPVSSPLTAGAIVHRGDGIGSIAVGGHASSGLVHFGVRLNGAYINPLLLLGGVPRAVLLPCCAAPP